MCSVMAETIAPKGLKGENMNSRDELFNAFVTNDLEENKGLIINALREIDAIMDEPQGLSCVTAGYLNNLLSHVTENSDFYKQYAGYKSILDFPVVNKEILKQHYQEVFVKKYAEKKDNKIKHTSGSTGTPFEVVWDHRKHCRMIADAKFFAQLGGVRSHESIVCWVQKDKHEAANPEREKKDNVYTLFCTYFDDDSICNLLKQTLQHDPKGIIAYASMWDAIANYIYRGKAGECQYHLSAIYAEAEALNERSREILSGYFNCNVYSRYGNEECGTIAQEDGTGNGFRLETASYYYEFLKLERDEPVCDGEVGRLVMTDLFNYAFPLIRYDTGDLAIKYCDPAGRTYLRELLGRQEDAVYDSKGRIVNQHTCLVFMKYFHDIMQFQLIQESLHKFTWRLITDNHTLEDKIIEESREILGQDTDYCFEYVNELEKRKSGKVPRIISRISCPGKD